MFWCRRVEASQWQGGARLSRGAPGVSLRPPPSRSWTAQTASLASAAALLIMTLEMSSCRLCLAPRRLLSFLCVPLPVLLLKSQFLPAFVCLWCCWAVYCTETEMQSPIKSNSILSLLVWRTNKGISSNKVWLTDAHKHGSGGGATHLSHAVFALSLHICVLLLAEYMQAGPQSAFRHLSLTWVMPVCAVSVLSFQGVKA